MADHLKRNLGERTEKGEDSWFQISVSWSCCCGLVARQSVTEKGRVKQSSHFPVALKQGEFTFEQSLSL